MLEKQDIHIAPIIYRRSPPSQNAYNSYRYALQLLLWVTTSRSVMSTQSHTVPLAALQVAPGAESRSDSQPARSLSPASSPALPPISRKKQAAVLLSAFTTIALTIGYNQCFGVYQEYYLSSSQDVLVPSPASQASPPTALLAFVGTLCYGLTWAGGILVNPVISRIEHGTWKPTTPSTRLWRRRTMRLLTPRTITISGVVMMALGFGLASLSTSIWHLLLTQGFLVGLGMSLLYFPLLAPAPEYFTSHRATAMGFVSLLSETRYSVPYKFCHSTSCLQDLNGSIQWA